jgi:hypothetical protein
MSTALNTEECPLDASLEKVLPGVHQWHRINNQQMNQMKRSIVELDAKVAQGFTDLENTIKGTKEETMQQLANTFMSISAQLLNSFSGYCCNSDGKCCRRNSNHFST